MSGSPHDAFEFGPYRLDLAERQLRRGTAVIRLTPKAFDTLAFLVQRPGHLVSKDDLIQGLWPDAHVEENNVAHYISVLRRVLEDGLDDKAYIETLPRVGYRFVAHVRKVQSEAPNGAALVSADRAEPAVDEAGRTATREAPTVRTRSEGARGTWHRGWAFALVGAVTVFGGWAATRSLRWGGREPVLETVAVLPFAVTPANAQGPALGLTFASVLREQLAASTPGHTLPITAAYRYVGVGAGTTVVQAGLDLNAGAVISGELQRKDATAVEQTTRVVRVADGRELWSDTREIDVGQLSDAEAPVVAAMREAVGWTRLGQADSPESGRATSFEARQAYVMGRYLWTTRTADGLFRSIQMLERAVELAPRNAVFHAGLADALAFDLARWREAEREAHVALQLDPSVGEAHASRGFVRLFWERDGEAAATELKQAIALRPEYATAHQWYALALGAHGDFAAAEAEIHEARQIDPFSLPILTDECHLLYLNHHFDRAETACRDVIRIDPGFLAAHAVLLEIDEQTGKGAEAVDEYFHWQALRGAPSIVSADELRGQFARAGLPGFWRAEIAALERLTPSTYADPLRLAQDYAHLGNREAALASLDHVTERFDLDSLFVWFDPVFDGLHSDRRFDAIGTRILAPDPAMAPTRAR